MNSVISSIKDALNYLLGLDQGQCVLTLNNMLFRALFVYVVVIFLMRLGKRRILGKPTTFDLALVLIFGGVMAKAITGDTPFFPTIAVGCLLIFVHWLFSLLSVYSGWIGIVLKGSIEILIKDGKIQKRTLQRNHMSERDLLSALRLNAQITNPEDVELAILERNGDISVIPRPKQPGIVEISVEKDVQTVKLNMCCSKGCYGQKNGN